MELAYIATTTTYNDGVTETEQTFKVSDDNTTITLTQSEAKELCEKLSR